MQPSRRDFIHQFSWATAGMFAASYAKPAAAKVLESRTQVNLTAGTDRRQTVYNAIKPFKSVIEKGVQNKRIYLKVNNVSNNKPLCATHPDAIRAVLDLVKEVTDKQVTIAESTSNAPALATFEQYGYMPLAKEYNIKFYDLNESTTTTHWIHDRRLMPVSIEIIDEFLAPDIYWISLALPKTHDSAIGTGGFKNMVMGSPVRSKTVSDKGKMHNGGSLGFNWNMFEIGRHVRPNFVVIDGHVGMEGSGPINGTEVVHNIALAGPDVVAVDRSTFECMGIKYEDVGYLQWTANAGLGQGNRDLIDYIGKNPADHVIVYKSHPNITRELEWKLGGTRAPEQTTTPGQGQGPGAGRGGAQGAQPPAPVQAPAPAPTTR